MELREGSGMKNGCMMVYDGVRSGRGGTQGVYDLRDDSRGGIREHRP